jgi:hypothetical protein
MNKSEAWSVGLIAICISLLVIGLTVGAYYLMSWVGLWALVQFGIMESYTDGQIWAGVVVLWILSSVFNRTTIKTE